MRRAVLLVFGLVVLVPGSPAGTYVPPPGDDSPTWSPDGTWIAFHTARGGSALVTAKVDGSGETRLFEQSFSAYALAPDWSLAAVVGSELVLVRLDGTGKRVLSGPAPAVAPAWAPDSTRLAFTDASGSVSVVAVDGTGLRRLAQGSRPAWSPDGTRIAFQGGTPADPDVELVAVDGSGRRVIAGGPGAQLEPQWSPDGTRIALLTQPAAGSAFSLAVVGLDGSGLRTYSGPGVSNPGSFAWSPDGRSIVYAVGANQGLVRLDLPSGRRVRLTSFGGSPRISPDASRIAFVAGGECRDREGIYVMRADATARRRLTNDCQIRGTAGDDVPPRDTFRRRARGAGRRRSPGRKRSGLRRRHAARRPRKRHAARCRHFRHPCPEARAMISSAAARRRTS
jgi:Tol biopolymer transport system component